MKVTWKEGRKTHTIEGSPVELESHLAYLTALGIEYKEVEEDVSSQDDSE